jgi:carbamoyl-phosphate synthase large subunit
MAIVKTAPEFESYVQDTLTGLVPPDIVARYPNDRTGQINSVLSDNPLLFDAYLTDATEIDVDCLCDGKDVFVCGIMEHIEEAGIHSGDSACSLPSQNLSDETIAELKRQTAELAFALKVGGLMNVQYAIKDGVIHLLEVNPRASRTVPFVAKVIGVPIAKIASRIMAGESLASFNLHERKLNHVAVKEAVFPFNRFPGVDTVLGPEMRSTGEVIGLDTNYAIAFAKSQMGAGSKVPSTGTVFVSVRDEDKPHIVDAVRQLEGAGFAILATGGTQTYLAENGISAVKINKVLEGRPHIVDSMKNGGVQLVINTTGGAKSVSDSRDIRRTALLSKIPYYTTVSGAIAAVEGIIAYREGNVTVRALQEYFEPA